MQIDYIIFYQCVKRVLEQQPGYFHYKNSVGLVIIKEDKLYGDWCDGLELINQHNFKYIHPRYTSRRFLHCYNVKTKKLISCIDVFLRYNKEMKHRSALIEKYGEENIEFYILPTNKKMTLFTF